MVAFIEQVRPSTKINKANSTSGKAPHPWNPGGHRMANELYQADFKYLDYEVIDP